MKRLVMVFVVMSLLATAFVGKAAAAPLTCSGAIAGGTYDSLTVPAGATCSIAPASTVTITGTVLVGTNAILNVNGTLNAGTSVFILNGAALNAPAPATVKVTGNLSVGMGGFVQLGSEGAGPFGDSVGGLLTGVGALGAQVYFTTISGGLTLTGGGGNSWYAIEDDTIGGNTIIIGYTGLWIGVIRTNVTGNVSLFNNQVMSPDIDVQSNTISRNLACSGNGPSVDVGWNTVGGLTLGQCVSNIIVCVKAGLPAALPVNRC